MADVGDDFVKIDASDINQNESKQSQPNVSDTNPDTNAEPNNAESKEQTTTNDTNNNAPTGNGVTNDTTQITTGNGVNENKDNNADPNTTANDDNTGNNDNNNNNNDNNGDNAGNDAGDALALSFFNDGDANPDHTKTQSLAVLDFFKMGNDDEPNVGTGSRAEVKVNDGHSKSKSVDQASKMTTAELSLENLKAHNEQQLKQQNDLDGIDETKESNVLPIKGNNNIGDTQSAKSEVGSVNRDKDINIDDVNNNNNVDEAQENEEKSAVLNNQNGVTLDGVVGVDNGTDSNTVHAHSKTDDSDDDGDDVIVNDGYAPPSVLEQHKAHESLPNIPTVIHADDLNNETNQGSNGIDNNQPNLEANFSEPAQNLADMKDMDNINDTLNMNMADDLDDLDTDDMNEDQKAVRNARKSMTDLTRDIDLQLGLRMENEDVVISDDDDDDDKNQWMEMSKSFILKEKQYKNMITNLQESLNESEKARNDITQFWETRVAQMEEEHQEQVYSLTHDNQKMALDIKTLKDEINEQNALLKQAESDKNAIAEQLQIVNMKFETQTLVHESMAKEQEQKRLRELEALKDNTDMTEANFTELQNENIKLNGDYDKLKMKHELLETQYEDMKVNNEELILQNTQMSTELSNKIGQLEQLTRTYNELKFEYDKIVNEYGDVSKKFEMLKQIAEEQDKILQENVFMDQDQKTNLNKQKSSIFAGDNAINSKNFAQHFKRLTSMSEILKKDKFKKLLEMAQSSSDDDDRKNDDSISIVTSKSARSKWTDMSHISRYSFVNYHTHDALKEFFYLTCLVVKLNLSAKYSISPDCAESNESLWKRALSENILFHEYYEFLYSEISNKYEYNINNKRNGNNIIHKVVITSPNKIKQLREHNQLIKNINENRQTNGFIKNKYDEYLNPNQIENEHKIKNKTTFSNNDLFGGSIKITTREQRNKKLEQRRLSQSSNRSNKSRKHRHKHHSKHGKRKHKHRHRKNKSNDNDNISVNSDIKDDIKDNNNDIIPGNDNNDNHPLNIKSNNSERRPSQTLYDE